MEKLTRIATVLFSAVAKILDPIYKQRSVWGNFYPLALLGHVCGFLPFQNILPRFKSLDSICFSFLSYPVLYSLSINIILYFVVFESTLYYYSESFVFKFSTDFFALQFFFVAYSAVKVSIHCFTIWRCPHILACLKSIHSYDTCYAHTNNTRILNRYIMIFLFGTLMSTTFNMFATFSDTFQKVQENFEQSSESYKRVHKNSSSSQLSPPVSRYWSLTLIPEPLTVTIAGYVTHTIAECAVFFSQSVIAFIVNCICERIDSLEVEISDLQRRMKAEIDHKNKSANEKDEDAFNRNHGKSKNNKVTISSQEVYNGTKIRTTEEDNVGELNVHTIWIKPSILPFQDQDQVESKFESKMMLNTVKTLPRKFLRLMDVCQELNVIANETIVISMTGSTVIIVSLSYLIFVLGSPNKEGSTALFPSDPGNIYTSLVQSTVQLIVILTIGRILNFANTGEKLETSVVRLNNCMKRFDHTDSAEITRICSYLWFLTSTADASLSGGGFFHLNRSALTTIVAPVITFIVILAQFRVTDIQFSGRNVTVT